jgi:hypothetical protein
MEKRGMSVSEIKTAGNYGVYVQENRKWWFLCSGKQETMMFMCRRIRK